SHWQYLLAACWVMLIAGKPPLPMPKLISTYGLVGREVASAPEAASLAVLCSENMNNSYSSQVTSHSCIQNGSSFTLCCGPSSGLRPGSESGLPMVNSPLLIGTIAYLAVVPGTVFV